MTTTQAGSSTATTSAARDHARAQEGTVVDARPTVPSTQVQTTDASGGPLDVVWAERIAGGNYSHRLLDRGTVLRLTDVEGDACASVVLYNAADTAERLNVADTMKIQWQVYSAAGQVLLSASGRALATVLEDTSGRHDGLYGPSSRARNEERYGDGQVHGPSPAGRELLTVAGLKYGLNRRDIPPALSFFQGVSITADGRPEFTGSAGPGATVSIVTEMPVIALIANAAHPLDPRSEYVNTPLDVLAHRAAGGSSGAPIAELDPERRRAHENTLEYLRAAGLA